MMNHDWNVREFRHGIKYGPKETMFDAHMRMRVYFKPYKKHQELELISDSKREYTKLLQKASSDISNVSDKFVKNNEKDVSKLYDNIEDLINKKYELKNGFWNKIKNKSEIKKLTNQIESCYDDICIKVANLEHWYSNQKIEREVWNKIAERHDFERLLKYGVERYKPEKINYQMRKHEFFIREKSNNEPEQAKSGTAEEVRQKMLSGNKKSNKCIEMGR